MSIHDKRIEFGSDNAQDKQKALRASGDMNADFFEMARNVYAHLNDEISKKIFEAKIMYASTGDVAEILTATCRYMLRSSGRGLIA